MTDGLRIRPANEASWGDLQAILTGTAGRCQCTRQRLGDHDWYALPPEARGKRVEVALLRYDHATGGWSEIAHAVPSP